MLADASGLGDSERSHGVVEHSYGDDMFWESEAPETVFTVAAFTCVHPRAPSTGIMLSLSQRCREGHEDPEVAAKAEAMAATLQFLD